MTVSMETEQFDLLLLLDVVLMMTSNRSRTYFSFRMAFRLLLVATAGRAGKIHR